MMKKMTYRDLTPELLNELYSCATAEALISACAAKELHLSQASAESLMQTLKKARELGRENLEKAEKAMPERGSSARMNASMTATGMWAAMKTAISMT